MHILYMCYKGRLYLMNLELYKTFYFIAEHGSISKAAEHLYITQPAVSRAIKQLEDDLGCALFSRTPKGVKPTQEGEILYQYIAQAFGFISAAEKKINDVKKSAQRRGKDRSQRYLMQELSGAIPQTV